MDSPLVLAENLKDIVRQFYERIWNKHDLSYLPTLLQENFSFRGSLGKESIGHQGLELPGFSGHLFVTSERLLQIPGDLLRPDGCVDARNCKTTRCILKYPG